MLDSEELDGQERNDTGIPAPNAQTIRVAIVDDRSTVRAGIKSLLRAADEIVVVGEAADGEEALELANTQNPDILLLDVELPILRGDIVMRRIRDTLPHIKVIVVSAYNDHSYVLSMLENGASGYITKDEAPTMLVDAIRSVHNKSGRIWISSNAMKGGGLLSIEDQTLTEKEVKILEQLLSGRSEVEIAASLALRENQIQEYLKLLMKKFETESMDVLKDIARRILPPSS